MAKKVKIKFADIASGGFVEKEVSADKPIPMGATVVGEVETKPISLEKKEEPKPWTPEDEFNKLYGWIGKGNIDDTLKAILKELVTIRMRG